MSPGRRIIPARAGFTPAPSPPTTACADHPRSRGVYASLGGGCEHGQGSSPLARGLRRPQPGGAPRGGIIPARAGFTGLNPPTWRPGADHPRSRGVYSGTVRAVARGGGSSPLARGLRPASTPTGMRRRIIPARAGFTARLSRRLSNEQDHPRSRGVYEGESTCAWLPCGSSPLARGLRIILGEEECDEGIIPARAGFTLANPWNPNEPVLYQTPAAFTADPGPAPPSCGSAVVVPRWTTTPSGA